MGISAVLEQVDPLPGTESQATIDHRNGHRRLGDRGANVRRHVVRSLVGMTVAPIAVGCDPGEPVVEVGEHIWIGVLLDHQRGRSVLEEEVAESSREASLDDHLTNHGRDVVQTARRRRQDDPSLVHLSLPRHAVCAVGNRCLEALVGRDPTVHDLLIDTLFAKHRAEDREPASKVTGVDPQRPVDLRDGSTGVRSGPTQVPCCVLDLVADDARPVLADEQKSDDEVIKDTVDKGLDEGLQARAASDAFVVGHGTPYSRLMPHPFPQLPPSQRGEVRWLRYDAPSLADNWWGDPAQRDVIVYTPPGWSGDPIPAIMCLIGFSGTGEKLLNRGMSTMSIANRIDRLIADGCPPFAAVLPDCMTSLGGSQYVDSNGIGRYATYVAEDLTQFVRGELGVGTTWPPWATLLAASARSISP